MTLTIEMIEVPPPILEFGGAGEFTDPKAGLEAVGPFSLRFGSAHKDRVRLGLVGSADTLAQGTAWFKRFRTPLASGKPNKAMYPDFMGFDHTFRTTLDLDRRWQVEIDSLALERSLALRPRERFESVLELFTKGVERLADHEVRPDVVVCCLPDGVVRACWSVSEKNVPGKYTQWARKQQKARSQGQLPLFEDWDVEETEEDLLNRSFRRALKARSMDYRMPIQIATQNLLVDGETNQDPATRAWNLGVALFYKAGGIPWRLQSNGPETCFVGVSFHHLKTSRRHLVYSSLAQAFSTEGEGFALRGDAVPWDPDLQGRKPHLTEGQAAKLAEQILAEYRERTGHLPARVVLHKTSKFDLQERKGFLFGLSQVPVVEAVNLLPSRFRLVRVGAYPPKRGTLCNVNGTAAYLFTTGYIPEWETYPGPHIPVPIQLVVDQGADLYRIASDVLGLSRMNWNTARDTSGRPITLRFAREVGGIMAEVGPGKQPNPSYRYYM